MKYKMLLPLTMAALIVVLILTVACGNSAAPATATTPSQKATTARKSATPAAGATKKATSAPGAGTPTKDSLDDSQGNGATADATITPGGPTLTPDTLDDSPANGTRTPKTPKAAPTQALRPPAVTLAVMPLMPAGNDSTVWSGGATAEQISQVKQYFAGRQVLFTWVEGGTGATGTLYSQTVEHCDNHYVSRGNSDQLVLGTQQTGTWRDEGSWDVVPDGDQILLSYQSLSNTTQTIPVGIQSNGDVFALNTGLVVKRQGPAVCE
jgi:hypothetical protein